MKRIFLPALLLGAAACSGEKPAAPQIPVVKSELSRETAPNVAEADRQQLAGGNTAFAFDLYRWIAKQPDKAGKNLFYSPHSISTALAMTYAGARGETEKEMAKALHFDLAQDKLHPAFNWLDLQLESRDDDVRLGEGDRPFKLRNVNTLFAQDGTRFEQPFLDALATNYGAGVHIVDFRTKTEESRVLINDWVSHQTEKKIENLLPQGSIRTTTRLVLANAIYFNASWASKFKDAATADAPFKRADGSTVQARTMNQEQDFAYVETEAYQALEMPYTGNQIALTVIVPKGELEMNADTWASATKAMAPTRVRLSFPKFEIKGESVSLKDALKALGMPSAFGDEANFTGMRAENDLLIQDVLHKAFIALDENGSEAAAATAVIVGEKTSAPPPAKEVKVDRPFFFAIRDVPTGAILFAGRVSDPTAK